MELSFWGVRGSIATPGPTTVRYGGNTTCLCVEVANRVIVLDAGTGIRPLGASLMSRGQLEIDMFISHSHMDHICGFPFFAPLYRPENNVRVWGRLHYEKTVEEVLSSQMDYSYFPLRAVDLPSNLSFHDMGGEDVNLGDGVIVKSAMMNHPVMAQAYRVEHEGRSIIFTGDMEPYYDVLETEDSTEMAVTRNQTVIDFFKGADILVIDSTYLPEEYEKYRGWGHCSLRHAIWFGGEAGVRHLVLTHHEPTRSDEQVDAMLEKAQDIVDEYGYRFSGVEMATERRVITL
jgi:phosphoribosyl 1,2-cyclic phosphodiesterase